VSDASVLTAGARERFSAPEERADGRGKVTGTTRYTADERAAGALHVRYVTSSVPHGIVRRIDVAAARAVPGVHAVITGTDALGIRTGRRLQDWPVLAWDRVRFVGERVAAVAAETVAAAEEAAALIELEIDPLPAVLNVDDALAADAPILHPDAASYRFLGPSRPPVSHPNLQGEVWLRKGLGGDDPAFDSLFATGTVFEHEFETGRQHQGAIEPHAALVSVSEDGLIQVQSTNKSPFTLRAQMAAALDVPPESIDIGSPTVGGDFGSKGLSLDEYPCLLLARATLRPVRTVAPYAEELTGYAPRHGARIRLRSVVDGDGGIVAHDADIVYDGGAYAAAKPIPELVPPGGSDILSAYDVPNMRVHIRSVYTNTVPGGHMRCPGEVQANFAGESHIDMMAAALGIDPLDFRARNAARDGAVSAAGETIRDSAAPEILRRLDGQRPQARGDNEGVGFALIARRQEGGKMSVAARIADDGAVEIVTGLADQGAGAHTVITRVAASVLSIPESNVRVVRASTDAAPLDMGVGASRVTFLAGHATEDAAKKLRAAIDSGLVAAGDTFVGTFDSGTETNDADFSYGGLAVTVRVDRETGVWSIVDALLVADVGTVINPIAHRGQIAGGFAQGVGAAMMEELVFSDGQITSANLGDYRLPTATDVPQLRTIYLTDVPGPGAFGAKSAGELSPSAVAPAVANAIAAATGVRVNVIPITPERLLQRLESQASGTSTTAMPVSHSAMGS
jgi:CO/xanthine dehydrogenase Mo-binding subunit